MLIATYIILVLLIIFACFIVYKDPKISSFTFCGTIITFLVVIHLSSHPTINKLTTKLISIEPQVNQIETKQKELQNIVTTLLKMVYISQDRATRYGPLPQHTKRLDKYIDTLNEYLGSYFDKEINNEIKELLKLTKEK